MGDTERFDIDGRITWHHPLQQTSQWEGALWGKPTSCDPASAGVPPSPPGSAWGYNDVRVNLLALELLRRWRRPLPDVLREHLMDPIGASDTRVWHGYRNSYVTIDGRRMQSVSGGGNRAFVDPTRDVIIVTRWVETRIY